MLAALRGRVLTRRGTRQLGVLFPDWDDGCLDVHICKNPSCCTLKNMCTLLHVLHLKISKENDNALYILVWNDTRIHLGAGEQNTAFYLGEKGEKGKICTCVCIKKHWQVTEKFREETQGTRVISPGEWRCQRKGRCVGTRFILTFCICLYLNYSVCLITNKWSSSSGFVQIKFKSGVFPTSWLCFLPHGDPCSRRELPGAYHGKQQLCLSPPSGQWGQSPTFPHKARRRTQIADLRTVNATQIDDTIRTASKRKNQLQERNSTHTKHSHHSVHLG